MPDHVGAAAAIKRLHGWTIDPERDAICKTYRFSTFNEAFGFMTRAALRAETLDHHPEWLNVYNRVEVTLTTHDVAGVTERDIAFAEFLDSLV